jgi:hypothetical protein
VTVRAHFSQVLGAQGASRAVVVAGDLNDTLDAATTQLLQGPPGSELETPGYARPDQGDGQRPWNLALRIPQAQRFTRKFRGRNELIDHPSLAPRKWHSSILRTTHCEDGVADS